MIYSVTTRQETISAILLLTAAALRGVADEASNKDLLSSVLEKWTPKIGQ